MQTRSCGLLSLQWVAVDDGELIPRRGVLIVEDCCPLEVLDSIVPLTLPRARLVRPL